MAFLGLIDPGERAGCEVHSRRTRVLLRLAIAAATVLIAIAFGGATPT